MEELTTTTLTQAQRLADLPVLAERDMRDETTEDEKAWLRGDGAEAYLLWLRSSVQGLVAQLERHNRGEYKPGDDYWAAKAAHKKGHVGAVISKIAPVVADQHRTNRQGWQLLSKRVDRLTKAIEQHRDDIEDPTDADLELWSVLEGAST